MLQTFWLVVLRIVLYAVLMLFVGYLLLWFRAWWRFHVRLVAQSKRKTAMWRHYQQRQQVSEQLLAKENLVSLRTLRQWPTGEQVYLMMHNVLWCHLDGQLGRGVGVVLPPKAFTSCQVSVARDLEIKYLYITNLRMILVDRQGEFELLYKDVQGAYFFVDSIEIRQCLGQRMLIHGHSQPEVIVQAYQLLRYFLAKEP
jgi:hypothetical protein